MIIDLLIEMAWKSGLIAGAALAGSALLRRRPAAERVVLLRLGVVLILGLPLMALAGPDLPISTSGLKPPVLARATSAPSVLALARSRPPVVAAPLEADPMAVRPFLQTARSSPRSNWVRAVVSIYALGVALLFLRLSTGLATLGVWTHRARRVLDPAWLEGLDRAARGGTRPRLLSSRRVASPLSWGVFPGVILINEDALPHAGRADAVLTHELAHVRRGDWLFLMLSRIVVALFWFNPLAWLLQRELVRQSEHAADAWAVRRVDRLDYAGALVAMAPRARPHAALGMAGSRSELARRVTAILAGPPRKGPPWPTAVAVVACVGFATPLAAVGFAPEGVGRGRIAEASAAAPSATANGAEGMPPRPVIVFETLPATRGNDPEVGERLIVAMRQRDQGLALMEAGARLMQERARDMRAMAVGLPDAADRGSLIQDANALDREAGELREEARALAARDPATLEPMGPDEERALSEELARMTEIGHAPPFAAGEPVNARTRDDDTVPPTLIEAAVSLGLNVAADAIATGPDGQGYAVSSDQHDAAADNAAATTAARIRQGAMLIQSGADQAEREAAIAADQARRSDARAMASEMRRQAADILRQADAVEAQADPRPRPAPAALPEPVPIN